MSTCGIAQPTSKDHEVSAARLQFHHVSVPGVSLAAGERKTFFPSRVLLVLKILDSRNSRCFRLRNHGRLPVSLVSNISENIRGILYWYWILKTGCNTESPFACFSYRFQV